jgi:hypothetical protein
VRSGQTVSHLRGRFLAVSDDALTPTLSISSIDFGTINSRKKMADAILLHGLGKNRCHHAAH